jgi:hypothetical protein
VKILHNEFAGPYHAEAGAEFIAELRTYLIEVYGQLLVRTYLASSKIGENLFGGRPEHASFAVPVFQAEHSLAVIDAAPGPLP